MIRIEHIVEPSSYQMEFVIEGMRNPMNSWDQSDSHTCSPFDTCLYNCPKKSCNEDDYNFCVGNNDKDLMMKLAKAGTDHRKFMRMMPVMMRITAPLYWWKEFDTYKVGTVANSCSTMHKLTHKPFELDDFSTDRMHTTKPREGVDAPIMLIYKIRDMLNECRKRYLLTDDPEEKKHWWGEMIQLLPSSYNQTRNVSLNYEVLYNVYHARKNHKLAEWRELCKVIEDLDYGYLITGGEDLT